MKKEEGFYFIPKQWLGDANIISMDWDCKGMHLHLMAIAWQQPLKGYLLDDDNLLRKLLGNPSLEDWQNRIQPQVFQAWKKKTIKDNGIDKNYWYQPGVIKTMESSLLKKPTRSKKVAEASVLDKDDISYPGFDLKKILNEKITASILYEKPDETDKINIWTIGVNMVRKQNESEAQARAFLAKLIRLYGEKTLAQAIGEISIKNIKPAEIHSYLTGMLKNKVKEQETGTKHNSGRGSVSI